ncbi:CynX/NimT family MFS transporter [Nitratireductor luteus]|uniref:MFS transporter n=1 Tax=Nitratireductor luteus TaxID=2976980 RepID=UPI00223ECBCE|nr:MFS transporter [Nitratireductor luteus]
MSGLRSGSPVAAVGFALAAQIATMLPVFLLGTLFPLLRADLGMGEGSLGYSVAVFFAASALGSGALAGHSDRFGPWPVARAALAVTAMLCLIVPFVPSAVLLLPAMVLAGLANGSIQPATNVALSRAVSPGRQGFAFGLKQASVPLASLLAGLAVPIIALSAGWRTAYVVAALLPAVLILGLPRNSLPPKAAQPHSLRPGWSRGSLVLLGIMSGVGAGSANSMAAFLVTSVEAQGIPVGKAGFIMALGSGVSIAVRILLGAAADRFALPLLLAVSVLMLGGAVAYWLFAQGGGWIVLVVATTLAFGMGWGWAGLSILAIIRGNPAAPGRASGVVQSGLFIGAVIGPLGFGWTVSVQGFDVAWTVLAVLTAVAAAIPAYLSARVVREVHGAWRG